MTICDDIETDSRPGLTAIGGANLLRITRLLLFFVVQGAAVILIGFAALFLRFEPGWSAEAPPVRPGDVRSGTLLLKTDGDGTTTDATRLGIDVDLVVSGPT